ncbi:T-cell surface glycoprotein CD8 alpha chain [Amia ocellicauda]|uniref:T-cell surface glycoprotein CD8 alpha chain n=1 Tax=Amia ocellicauda TaxID=2972642 RepID=UPI003464CE35
MMEMNRLLWLVVLLLSLPKFYCAMTQKTANEGEKLTIKCNPDSSNKLLLSTVYWFRQNEMTVETLVSVDAMGKQKMQFTNILKFEVGKNSDLTFTIQHFTNRDSGLYYCATIINNKLHFGEPTRISAVPVTTTTKVKPTEKITQVTNATVNPCACKTGSASSNVLKTTKTNAINCEVIVWAPLVAGCGLLFVILIITIVSCNKVRTRRCPHHYKRRPKKDVNGRPSVPDRYV